uniref:Uncharacterized protein n=1 Tax=Schistocephalus solidus TaxID=70667 RepID=A0A0X3P2J2_SCHSO
MELQLAFIASHGNIDRPPPLLTLQQQKFPFTKFQQSVGLQLISDRLNVLFKGAIVTFTVKFLTGRCVSTWECIIENLVKLESISRPIFMFNQVLGIRFFGKCVRTSSVFLRLLPYSRLQYPIIYRTFFLTSRRA